MNEPMLRYNRQCLLIFLVFAVIGCSLFDSDRDAPPQKNPPDMQLFATVFGQGRGIWTFEPKGLEVLDTIITGSSWSINFSPDYRTVYSAWRDSDTSRVYAIERTTGKIINQQELWSSHIQIDRSGKTLISMGGIQPGIQILDAQTLGIIFEGHTRFTNTRMAQIAPSPLENKVFALVQTDGESEISGVMIFNYETYEVEAIIPLTDDENRRRGMQGSYIDVSPDGRYVYVTVFNWQGGGGYGSFHVIDVIHREPVFEAICGGFAWIGVAPDGRYVYLSDPAGTPFYTSGIGFEFPPTNRILRYEVNRRRMEVFANGGSTFGLSGINNDLLITSSIVVAPDSRSMYIRVLSSGLTKEGHTPAIIHIDTRTKELLKYFLLPPDSDGFIRAWMHQLKIGRKSS